MEGHYLNRDGHGDFSDLVTFATHVLASQEG